MLLANQKPGLSRKQIIQSGHVLRNRTCTNCTCDFVAREDTIIALTFSLAENSESKWKDVELTNAEKQRVALL